MNVLKFSLQACEQTDVILFESMLRLTQRQLTQVWQMDDSASVIIVDVEQPEGRAFWQTHLQTQSTVLIAYAKYNLFNSPWFLRKPLRIHAFIRLLNALSEETTHEDIPVKSVSCENFLQKTATNFTSSFHGEQTLFEPQAYLLGLLQNSLQANQAIRFEYQNFPPIYTMPAHQQCFLPAFNPNQLSAINPLLYQQPACDIQQIPLTHQQAAQQAQAEGLVNYPLDTVLWLACILASQGRLMVDSHPAQTVRLKRWPHFLILPHEIMHIKLAAFMLKHTAGLVDIAEKTGFSLTTVIDFFNACQTLSLIQQKVHADITLPPKTLSQQQHHLFENILKRLSD